MDLPSALERLQTAIQEWQRVYTNSPNLHLRHQVAALQAEVQQIQAQAGTSEGSVSVHVPGSAVPADSERQLTPSGTLAPPADRKTYRQRYITCGKPSCRICTDGPGHGPYWYAYWREGTKIRSAYIGKQRPPP